MLRNVVGIRVLLIAITLAFGSPVYAGQGGISVGVKGGWVNVDPAEAEAGSSLSLGIVAKYFVTNALTLEGEISPLLLTKGALKSKRDEREVDAISIVGIFAAYNLPIIQPGLYLRGKAGLVSDKGTFKYTGDSADFQIDIGEPTSEDASGKGFAFGLGAGYKISEMLSIDADYTVLPLLEDDYGEEYDVSFFGVNLNYVIK